jgi:hypothetical protein
MLYLSHPSTPLAVAGLVEGAAEELIGVRSGHPWATVNTRADAVAMIATARAVRPGTPVGTARRHRVGVGGAAVIAGASAI